MNSNAELAGPTELERSIMARGTRVPDRDVHDPYGREPSAFAWVADGRIHYLRFASDPSAAAPTLH